MSNVNLQRHTKKINRNYKNGKPQEDLVLDYLKEHGSMDEFEAKEFDINRNSLTRTVSELKKRGFDIKSDPYDRGVSTFSHKPKTVRNYVLESS